MSISQSASNAFVTRLLSSVAVLPPLTAAMLTPAAAQTALELPGIVVEGATLEAPPPAPQRRPVAASTPSPAPSSSTAEAPAGPPVEAAEETATDAGPPSDQVAGIPRAQLGTAVTVVTGEDLQRQQIRHAADALRSLPGVSVNRTSSPAGLTQVRIRGAEHNHTLVLIDGIEANAGSDGGFDFSDLMTEDIERIEVIRGPQSALYGSNAVGGVVNIITRSGKGPLTVTARAEGGSFGTFGGAVRAAGGSDRAWGALSVQHQDSRGFNIAPEGLLGEDDGFRITSLSATAGAMLADNIRLGVNIRRSDKHLDRDDQLSQTRDGHPIASDTLSIYDSTVLLMGADLRWDMLDGDLTHVFRVTRNETRRDDVLFIDTPLPDESTDEAYKAAYQLTYRFLTPWLMAKHGVTGLVERGHEQFSARSLFGSANATRNQTAFAGEWRGEFFDRVFISAGLRHDQNDTFEDFTTWRTALSIPIPELGIRPHASAGTGVKAPTMIEQFGTTANFISNPNLKPEESRGWDAGVEFTFLGGRVIFDVTYFEADLTNKIFTEFVDCPLSPFGCAHPINLAGISERRGIETDVRIQILPTLSLGLAYTYLDAVESTGEREIRRPPHALRGDVSYGFDEGRGMVRLAATYNGEMDDDVFGTRVTLDDYWLVSAAASYKLNPGVEIYGRVENLFDEDYEEVFGFETAGIAAYAGLKWTFDYERLGDGLSLK